MRRVWLEDPLLCPHCGDEIWILSFITDPPVVNKILRHVAWHPGEPSHKQRRRPRTCPTGVAGKIGSGGRIRTCDLWVMSPTSYLTAPPRSVSLK